MILEEDEETLNENNNEEQETEVITQVDDTIEKEIATTAGRSNRMNPGVGVNHL